MHLNSILPPPELSRSVSTQDSIDRLRRLQDAFRGSPLDTFSTWEDARSWLDEAGAAGVASDAVLRPVLIGAKRSLDETWHRILMLLLWRHLAQISHELRRLDRDQDARDSQVVWAFLQALHRLDPARRPHGLGQKLLNDARHDVRQHYARERACAKRCVPLLAGRQDKDDTDDRAGVLDPGAEDVEFAVVEFRHDRDWACVRLKDLARRGRISRADSLILIGCHLYGRSIEEMAARLGLTYQTAKRSRLRAVAYLNKWAKNLSPDLPETPLKPLGRARRKERSNDGSL